MANKIITDLQLRDNVTDDVNFPVDDGIQSYRVTGLQLLSYILAAGNVKASALDADSVTTEKIADGNVTLAKLSSALQQALIPTGCYLPFGGSTVPSGFLLCDGSAVSRSTYSALFAALGTTYGAGNGSTTFNLPDLRGRVPVGKDNMGGTAASRMTSAGSGVDGATLGASGGAQTHTLTIPEIPSHGHETPAARHSAPANAANPGGWLGGAQYTNDGTAETAWTKNHANYTGGGGAHNNTQPSLVANYIIKT